MRIDTKHLHFNIKRLFSDAELVFIFLLCAVTFTIAEFRLIPISAEFYMSYRPDLWMHFLFGYGVNKFWRLTYKTRGLLRNVVADFYLSVAVHMLKEVFDVARAQSLLRFDFIDITAASLGLLVEDIKYTIQTKFRSKGVRSKA